MVVNVTGHKLLSTGLSSASSKCSFHVFSLFLSPLIQSMWYQVSQSKRYCVDVDSSSPASRSHSPPHSSSHVPITNKTQSEQCKLHLFYEKEDGSERRT